MRALIIDDERLPLNGWTDIDVDVVRTSADAMICLASRRYDEVWLDHDLGGDDTTRPVAMFLAERAADSDDLPTVYVHSMNPVGAAWLMDTMKDYHPIRVEPVPNGLIVPLD